MQVFVETSGRGRDILLNCFLTLFFETRFCTNSRTCHFSWTNRPRSHRLIFTCLCPLLGCVCTATASFHVCDGDLNQVFMLSWQTVDPLSHFPSHFLCNFIVFSSCLAPARDHLSPSVMLLTKYSTVISAPVSYAPH